MKNRFLNYAMSLITSEKTYTTEEKEKMRYGLEAVYLTVTKFVVILILAIVLDFLSETIILFIFYNILRFYGFGFHASKSSECLLLSIVLFLLFPYLIVKDYLSLVYQIPIALLCLLNFILFAPADTIKRPLINKKKRTNKKILTIALASLYFLMILSPFFKFNQLIVIALINEAIMTNPMIYKIFKQPFNNYKYYLE